MVLALTILRLIGRPGDLDKHWLAVYSARFTGYITSGTNPACLSAQSYRACWRKKDFKDAT